MNRYRSVFFIVCAILVGGCVHTARVPVAGARAPIVVSNSAADRSEITPATLPVTGLLWKDLLLPPSLQEVPPVNIAVVPVCDIAQSIKDARTLLEPVPVALGKRVFRYTERRNNAVKTYRDPEKTIALAFMDTTTCALQVTTITKRGQQLISPTGFAIEAVRRSNGIQWNNWATEFRVTAPANQAVVLLKYPYDAKTSSFPLYYTPHSSELHLPELVESGSSYLAQLARSAVADLHERRVGSLVKEGAMVGDEAELPIEFITRLVPIEHMDLAEFLLDPAWTTERIYTIIGTNGDRFATYTCSPASACGPMQFTKGTYAFMRELFPAANLIKNFEAGARDPRNAMKAAFLLHNYNASQLVKAFGREILKDPHLEEYLAAAYNTGIGRVIAVVTLAKQRGISDWAEARDVRKNSKLLAETKGYIAKLRFVRDQWQQQLAVMPQ